MPISKAGGLDGYKFDDARLNSSHGYLLPTVLGILRNPGFLETPRRLFELGCGNGAAANKLAAAGYNVTGVDPSEDGIRIANSHFPHLKLSKGSAYDDLAKQHGQFPIVISLEVVEHVYAPRKFAATLFDLVEPGGSAIISTVYHGYWKNLALAITGRLDAHFTALWDHGHIKFWSMKTLRQLLEEAGFQDVSILRVGRFPTLAKSMIAIAKKSTIHTQEGPR